MEHSRNTTWEKTKQNKDYCWKCFVKNKASIQTFSIKASSKITNLVNHPPLPSTSGLVLIKCVPRVLIKMWPFIFITVHWFEIGHFPNSLNQTSLTFLSCPVQLLSSVGAAGGGRRLPSRPAGDGDTWQMFYSTSAMCVNSHIDLHRPCSTAQGSSAGSAERCSSTAHLQKMHKDGSDIRSLL